jgi:alkylation response protein AidB-like acyl-CoA dehydrogenase
MDLSYSEEYERFRGEVQAFLKQHWPPQGEEAELSFEEKCARFRERATAAGYLARSIPRKYGGSEQEPDVLKVMVIAEEFREAQAPQEMTGIGPSMLVPTLLEHGDEWQKETFIPPTIRSEMLWCQGYSEPGAGSDLASLQTKATLDGDEWIISGQKIWTTAAQLAHYMFCLCRSEPEEPKHAGISYFLIDMKTPGIEVRPLTTMTGTAEFNEVFFNDIRVPARNIVGKRGQGWIVSLALHPQARAQHDRRLRGTADELPAAGRAGAQRPEEGPARDRGFQCPAAADRAGGLRRGPPLLGLPPGHAGCTRPGGRPRRHDEQAQRNPHREPHRGAGAGPCGRRRPLLHQRQRHPRCPRRGRELDPENWIRQYIWSLGIAIGGGTANIQRNVIAERGLGLPRDRAADRSK